MASDGEYTSIGLASQGELLSSYLMLSYNTATRVLNVRLWV